VTAHLSEAEARRLGLVAPASKKRTTRKAADGPYHTRCCACREEFTVEAAETRHVESTSHARYEVVVG